MKKISLFKIFRLLTLGIVVLAIFAIKKNNSANQKSFLGQNLISPANADVPVEGCGGGGGGYAPAEAAEGAEGAEGGCAADGCAAESSSCA